MEQIKIKILKYLKRKNENSSANIPNLELFLMANYQEREYIGVYLIQKVNEMEKDGFLNDSKTGIYITQKGLDYLRNNSE